METLLWYIVNRPVRTYVAYNNCSYNTPSEIITLGDSSKGISPGDGLIIY